MTTDHARRGHPRGQPQPWHHGPRPYRDYTQPCRRCGATDWYFPPNPTRTGTRAICRPCHRTTVRATPAYRAARAAARARRAARPLPPPLE